jgi:hypothetical protein
LPYIISRIVSRSAALLSVKSCRTVTDPPAKRMMAIMSAGCICVSRYLSAAS